MRKTGCIAVAILACTALLLWGAVIHESARETLTVAFLDVGQGDAALITTPGGRQVLIDGGRSRSVLRALSKEMAWYDRTIDVVIATHPDTDHVGGLFPVLERYRVLHILRPGVGTEKEVTQSLLKEIANEDATETLARRAQRIDLGTDAYIDILFPDRDVSGIETNAGSIIARLVYGDTSFLFTGDAPQAIEEYLVSLDGSGLQSDVLKVGHHGSDTSSAPLFVGFVSPEHAVISRGCDNSYGHPHETVLATLNQFNIQTHDTCTDGTVTFTSDGREVSLR